jgi:hypothetical protein
VAETVENLRATCIQENFGKERPRIQAKTLTATSSYLVNWDIVQNTSHNWNMCCLEVYKAADMPFLQSPIQAVTAHTPSMAYSSSGRTTLFISGLCTTSRSDSYPNCCTPRYESHRYQLNRRLGGPHCRYKGFRKEESPLFLLTQDYNPIYCLKNAYIVAVNTFFFVKLISVVCIVTSVYKNRFVLVCSTWSCFAVKWLIISWTSDSINFWHVLQIYYKFCTLILTSYTEWYADVSGWAV